MYKRILKLTVINENQTNLIIKSSIFLKPPHLNIKKSVK